MLMHTAFRDLSVNYIPTELMEAVPELRKNGGTDFQMALLIMKMFEGLNPELQSELGDCYYQGQGVSEDTEKALEMFQKAAGKGSIRAQYDLGWYYYDRGEYLRSIECFSFCISHKNELDEHKLGRCYMNLGDAYSKISEPKIVTAIENLAIAADKFRLGFACRCLGLLYSQVGTNHFAADKAVKYLELGAKYGDSYCAHALGIRYIFGDEGLNIKSDRRKAEAILLAYKDSDDPDVFRDLGLLYMVGGKDSGIANDYVQSKTYFERSWELSEDPLVAKDLGYVYFYLSEYEKAEKMLTIADEAGYKDYSDFLGRMYKDGNLGSRDLKKAEYYYQRAFEADKLNNVFTCVEFAELLEEIGKYQAAYEVADRGEEKFNDIEFVFIKAKLILTGKVINNISHEQAAEKLAICLRYDTHKGEAYLLLGNYYFSTNEFRKAEKQFMDAFALGMADAAVSLGRLYETGGGTIKADPNKAFEWYSKAADSGSVKGQNEAACFKKGIFGGYRRVRSL